MAKFRVKAAIAGHDWSYVAKDELEPGDGNTLTLEDCQRYVEKGILGKIETAAVEPGRANRR